MLAERDASRLARLTIEIERASTRRVCVLRKFEAWQGHHILERPQMVGGSS